jgi:hypothetical protein
MATIKVEFKCLNAKSARDGYNEIVEFEVCSGLQDDVDSKGEEVLEGCEDDGDDDDDWDLDGYEIVEYDDDFNDPGDFKDLDDYAEFVENVEEHGESFKLRYDDIGESSYESQYVGDFESKEAYAQSYYEDNYDIPDFLQNHIDWDSVANELLMDYSTYDGGMGVFIFRD